MPARSASRFAASALVTPDCSWADQSAVAPYEPGRPCEIAIDFSSPDRLREYANRKGVEVTGPRSLVVRGDDWWSAWSGFFF